MRLSCGILLGLVGLASCITVDDFYPFNPQHDQRLPNGDSTSSHKIALSVPAKFYDTEYDYLWINTDGYISFEADTSDVSASDFPFNEALLSPFMSDLDTSRQGEIYYRESNDLGILIRATSDIRHAFPNAASDFDAESAFIVTWNGVEGRSIDGSIAKFTFQSILVSNGRDTYAIFLYPERKMGVVPAGIKLKSALFQARAGFNQGRSQFLEMYPVESLVDHRNSRRNGEWIFQIGGEGVKRNGDVKEPENVRTVKRQLVNVQEVYLEDDDDSDFAPPPDTRSYDYCSRDEEACVAENSQCVNHDSGYCCRCDTEYYGNGKVCVENDEPIRVNGNVSGVVDVRAADGSTRRMSLTNVDFHSYIITNEGRAHSAVSGVNDAVLGRAFQPISAFGEIVGWLFAVPTAPAVNGFQFTGGSFQRQVSIRFKNSDYKFDLRQRFLGIRKESNGDDVVVAHTNFVGLLPEIPENAVIKMPTYTEEYVKKGPGRIASSSVRNYTVDDTMWQYDLEQTIIFNECSSSLSSVPDRLKLIVSGTFLNYHDDDNNVRYAMNDKIIPFSIGDSSSPCFTGEHNCDPTTAQCEPIDGTAADYRCRCRDGYAGNGRVCADVNECVFTNSPCPENSVCHNSIGSYNCVCREGWQMNERQECEAIVCPGNQIFSTCAGCFTTCEQRNQARVCTAQCRIECTCPPNTFWNGNLCVTAEQCPSESADVDVCALNTHSCSANARCINAEGSYRCECNVGYTGDGFTCTQVQCPGNQVFSTCAGCFTTCEERNRPTVCTQQCRVQCTCPPNTYLNGDMCVSANQCPRPADVDECALRTHDCSSNARCINTDGSYTCSCNPGYTGDGRSCQQVQCPGNQVFSTCAGCFTTCEERNRPTVCTQQCRVQCTCPPNTYLNGDMCVSANQCPRPADVDECALRTHDCSSNARCINTDGSYACSCNPGYTGDGRSCQQVQCPGNQVFSTCAGCFTTCEERNRPKVCTQQCRVQCTCPPNTYLNGDMCVTAEQCPSEEQGPCTINYNEALELLRQNPDIQDGPDFPECDENGLYTPRQCSDWTQICWCVDPEIGSAIPGTEHRENCTDISAVPKTRCERERERALAEQSSRPNSAGPVYQPLCTEAGAYEPLQYHPQGYYMCVDINGRELSRHNDEPECLTQCQLEAYYADTQNTLTGTTVFVPQCQDDGNYNSVQCDPRSRTCYCANLNGEEIRGTRVQPTDFTEASLNLLNCDTYRPNPELRRPVQLVFANSRSVNIMDLPATVDSRARRFFDKAGRMAVGIAFDCSRQNIYWTDIATRAIYKAPIFNATSVSLVVSGLRSPEGIAVDFITGNIYWTDSGTDRIEVAGADGSNRAVLVSTGMKNPRGIAVDPFGGKMYWTDWERQNPRVMMANLDGTNVEKLAVAGLTLPNDITIDPYFRKACVLDGAVIKCMNLDGSEQTVVWRNSAAGSPFGLARDGNKIYYSNRVRTSVLPIKRMHVVDTAARTSIPLSGPVGVHGNAFGVAVAYTECPVGYNRCSRANGGCSHLCLAVPNGRTCKCPDRNPNCTE